MHIKPSGDTGRGPEGIAATRIYPRTCKAWAERRRDCKSEEETQTPHDMTEEVIQMTYKVNRAQYRALEGLAHWCYQAARCDAEHDAEGSEQARQTLSTFPAQLDRLGIPYWVQNTVSAWAQDFRAEGNIRVAYLDQALRRRGIACEGV